MQPIRIWFVASILVATTVATAQSVQELTTVQLIERAPAPDWVPAWVKELGRPENSDIGDELAKRARSDELTPAEWKQLLESQRVLRMRSKWPRNEPVQAAILLPSWLCHNLEVRVAAAGVSGAVPIRSGRRWEAPCGLAGTDMLRREPAEKLVEKLGSLGTPPPQSGRVQINVEVRSGGKEFLSSVLWPEAKQVYAAQFERSVLLVDSTDEAILPVKSPELTGAVRSAVSIRAYPSRWADSSIHISLGIGVDRREQPDLKGLGLGIRVEFLRDEKVIQSVSVADASMWAWAKDQWQANQTEVPELAAQYEKFRDEKERARWKVRVVGDGPLSLSAWDCERYWAGEYTLSLDEVVR